MANDHERIHERIFEKLDEISEKVAGIGATCPAREKRLDGIESCRRDLVRELQEAIGENDLAAAYLTEDRRIRLLLSQPGDITRPLPCRTKYGAIDLEQLASLDIVDWEQLGDFFSQLFRDSRFHWSRFGRQPFRPEYACQIDDAFVLVD